MSRHSSTVAQSSTGSTPSPSRGLLQRACACGQHNNGGECQSCRQKRQGSLQRATNSAPTSEVPPIVHEVLSSSGQPIDASTRAFMEPRFGHDFSRVRMHTSPVRVIQTKLVVNQPGDEYEQEADQIAEQVTHMAEPPVQRSVDETDLQTYWQRASLTSQRTSMIQRQSGSQDTQRKPKKRDEEDKKLGIDPLAEIIGVAVQRKNRPRKGRPNYGTLAVQTASSTDATHAEPEMEIASEGTLATGGTPLPAALRAYYQARFSRDFASVRIHTGAESAHINDAINAHAFTYGHHIWLGDAMRVEPSLTLAHELTHVVQQTQPALVRPAPPDSSNFELAQADPVAERRRDRSAAMPGGRRAEKSIQRFTPYWEPYDYSGAKNHAEILPEFGKQNHIFTEAPVPNADRLGADFDKKGQADFYDASTTVGVYFSGHEQPQKLDSPSKLQKDGARFSHVDLSAPFVEDRKIQKVLIRVDKAPSSIRVGDLKPTHGTIEALEGTAQVQNYLQGFKKARDEANGLPDPSQREPSSSQWPVLVTAPLEPSNLIVPDKYKFPTASGQNTQTLILKSSGKPVKGTPKAVGKCFVHPDPHNKGIWNYFWVPDTPIAATALPESVNNLGTQVQQKIINPLLVSPIKPAKKQKSTSAPRAAKTSIERTGPRAVPVIHQAHLSGTPVIRRQSATAPAQDTFDLGAWKKSQQDLTAHVKGAESGQDFSAARDLTQSVEVHDKIEAETGLKLSGVPATAQQAVHTFRQIEFWTGNSAVILGPLRKVFGTTFIKVAQVYQKVKEKFHDILKKKPKPAGKSGFLGAALHAAFSVVKLAGVYVIQQTAHRLIQSLQEGVAKKLKALIDPDRLAELEEKIDEVKDLQQRLEEAGRHTVESLVESMVGPYADTLKKLEDVEKLVSNITTLVNWVRWGARVLACLSPPGFGCLWIAAQAVLEAAAAKVAETCWFKKKITPFISGINFVRTLPATLADIIVKKLRGVLPEKLHDVFADIDTSAANVGAGDIDCDEAGDGADAMTPERQALQNLIETVGEDRYEAFAALSQKWGIKADAPLTVEQINKIKEALVSSKVTADELKKYAQNPDAPDDTIKEKTRGIEQFLNDVKSGSSSGTAGARGKPQVIRTSPEAKELNAKVTREISIQVVGGIGMKDYERSPVSVTMVFNIDGRTIYLENVKAMVHQRVEQPEKIEFRIVIAENQDFDFSKYPNVSITAARLRKGNMFSYTLPLKDSPPPRP